MSLQNSLGRYNSQRAPLRLEGLCDELNRTAQMQLEHIMSALATLAPRPGVLVHVRAHRLAIRMNGFEPVIFSAIDASTLLQVAQVYLTSTTAAAFSFLDFVSHCFPFTMKRIMTCEEEPFVNQSGSESHRKFTELVKHLGISHEVIEDSNRDTLFALTSKLTFGGISEGLIARSTEGEVQRELAHFLFFHNNYRTVPWLGGKTPVQKLATFEGIAPLDAFDPYCSIANNHFKD